MGWEVRSRTKLLDCSPWLRVYVDEVLLEDKKTLIPDFNVIEAAPFAIIFPVLADGRIALIRHYRHAVGKIVYDLPGGDLEEDEAPLACAQRELLEETGLQAPDWRHLGTFRMSGVRGITDAHCYMAAGAVRVAEPNPGDLQSVSVHPSSPQELLRMWSSDEWAVLDTAAVVGLGLGHLGLV